MLYFFKGRKKKNSFTLAVMSLIVQKYRKGFKFQCPISKTFYGPYFKTREAIENFLDWYDGDVRYIGTWMSENKQWQDLIKEWSQSDFGKSFVKYVSFESISSVKRKNKTLVLDNMISAAT